MGATYARVNPDILTWARERARLSIAALASKLSVSEEKVDAWERGEQFPTFRQAQNFADRTHVPFGYLYLKRPPQETLPLPDLRTVGGQAPHSPSPELIEIVQVILRRQQWYADYLRDQGAEPNPHVGRFNVHSSIKDVVSDMRRALGVDEFPQRGNWEDYFRSLVRHIEAAGILVMRQGFLSHHSRPLSVSEFRGFAIADPLAPVIFINQADAPTARPFTLIHELAHIWIGSTGISDASPDSERKEEVFCNAVAAEFLVPEREFEAKWRETDDWKANLPVLETHFKVSSWVIARRALTLGKISRGEYNAFVYELQQRFRSRPRSASGPPFYRNHRSQVGETFSRAVISEALSGRLLLRDAGRLLNIKPSRISTYARELGV